MFKKKFNLIVNKKIKPFSKNITVDSDKSLSIRSFLIGSICQNSSIANNVLESDDVKSTINACKKLGVKISKIKSKSYKIFGRGLGSLVSKRNMEINFGNSGTLARLLIGILSTTPNIEIKIKGDHSLNKRSMKKLINLMSKFGAFFLPLNKFTFPLKLISSKMPVGISYKAGVSAQLKSAVILAGLNSYGNTEIIEELKSRDHTENLLSSNTKAIKINYKKRKKKIIVYGKKLLKPKNIKISGDPSSAAFFVALALLNKNSSLRIRNVGLNPTRIGFYEILKKSKAKIKFTNIKKNNNEKVGDILIKSSELRSIKAPSSFYPRMTDEYPILFVVAALTKGISIFNNIGDLASKESNRVLEMQKILTQVGVKSIFNNNQLKIFGKGAFDASRKKITVPNLGDHRICMSAFVLSILTGAEARIKNFETVYTSSPSFLKIMKSIGAKFESQK